MGESMGRRDESYYKQGAIDRKEAASDFSAGSGYLQ